MGIKFNENRREGEKEGGGQRCNGEAVVKFIPVVPACQSHTQWIQTATLVTMMVTGLNNLELQGKGTGPVPVPGTRCCARSTKAVGRAARGCQSSLARDGQRCQRVSVAAKGSQVPVPTAGSGVAWCTQSCSQPVQRVNGSVLVRVCSSSGSSGKAEASKVLKLCQ